MDKSRNLVRILIADDQTHVQKGLQAVLQLEDDLEVVGVANNGLEAVEMASYLRPDVILMDISMPYLDGVEASQIILQDFTTVIIGMHTQCDQQIQELAEQAGISAFIVKDAPVDIISDVIRSVWLSASEKYAVSV